jgi:hypothetical protein
LFIYEYGIAGVSFPVVLGLLQVCKVNFGGRRSQPEEEEVMDGQVALQVAPKHLLCQQIFLHLLKKLLPLRTHPAGSSSSTFSVEQPCTAAIGPTQSKVELG